MIISSCIVGDKKICTKNINAVQEKNLIPIFSAFYDHKFWQ